MSDTAEFGERYCDCAGRIALQVRSSGRSHAVLPACPDWQVRDLVAHLTGLAEDWIDGNLDGYASEAWTNAQVERHRATPVNELLDEWMFAAERVAALPDPGIGPPARFAFGDALIHEADLLDLLDPGTEPPATDVVLHFGVRVERWHEQIAASPVRAFRCVTTEGRTWTVGDAEADGPFEVRASTYELWRWSCGRRTRAETAQYEWTGDADAVIALGLSYPFTYPEGS